MSQFDFATPDLFLFLMDILLTMSIWKSLSKLSDTATVDTVKCDLWSIGSVKGKHGGDMVHLIPEDEW